MGGFTGHGGGIREVLTVLIRLESSLVLMRGDLAGPVARNTGGDSSVFVYLGCGSL